MMEDYQHRMLDEQKALSDKTDKLGMFIGSDKYLVLHKDEQDRMSRQWAAMKDYRQALHERIEAFLTKGTQ